MSKIDYLEIIKKAAAITWKNRYLWWFGFFIALSSGGGSFNYPFDQKDWRKLPETKIGADISNFISAHPGIIIATLSVFLLLFLILAAIGIVSRAGLIKSVQKIDRGETAGFKTGFSEGKKYFWRLFFISLATGLFMLCLIVVMAIPIVFLFYNKNYAIGGILAFLGIVIFVPILVAAAFTRLFARLYAVTSDLNVRDAIEKGYLLFRKNIPASLLQSLIFLILGAIFGLGILFLLFPLALIFLLIGGLLYLILQKIGVAIAAGLGIAVFLLALLFLRAVYETFAQAVWFFFFKKIASPKAEEKIAETVPEIKTAPAPDPAG